mmetsp:Transcript_31776/g.50729  ORF Transcript_31776/g.50729 Transcript_31776/m.50729 type:complete len:902 (-) Transcript_31776:403-3108(-)
MRGWLESILFSLRQILFGNRFSVALYSAMGSWLQRIFGKLAFWKSCYGEPNIEVQQSPQGIENPQQTGVLAVPSECVVPVQQKTNAEESCRDAKEGAQKREVNSPRSKEGGHDEICVSVQGDGLETGPKHTRPESSQLASDQNAHDISSQIKELKAGSVQKAITEGEGVAVDAVFETPQGNTGEQPFVHTEDILGKQTTSCANDDTNFEAQQVVGNGIIDLGSDQVTDRRVIDTDSPASKPGVVKTTSRPENVHVGVANMKPSVSCDDDLLEVGAVKTTDDGNVELAKSVPAQRTQLENEQALKVLDETDGSLLFKPSETGTVGGQATTHPGDVSKSALSGDAEEDYSCDVVGAENIIGSSDQNLEPNIIAIESDSKFNDEARQVIEEPKFNNEKRNVVEEPYEEAVRCVSELVKSSEDSGLSPDDHSGKDVHNDGAFTKTVRGDNDVLSPERESVTGLNILPKVVSTQTTEKVENGSEGGACSGVLGSAEMVGSGPDVDETVDAAQSCSTVPADWQVPCCGNTIEQTSNPESIEVEEVQNRTSLSAIQDGTACREYSDQRGDDQKNIDKCVLICEEPSENVSTQESFLPNRQDSDDEPSRYRESVQVSTVTTSPEMSTGKKSGGVCESPAWIEPAVATTPGMSTGGKSGGVCHSPVWIESALATSPEISTGKKSGGVCNSPAWIESESAVATSPDISAGKKSGGVNSPAWVEYPSNAKLETPPKMVTTPPHVNNKTPDESRALTNEEFSSPPSCVDSNVNDSGITPHDPRYRRIHDPDEPILAQKRSFDAILESAIKRDAKKHPRKESYESEPPSTPGAMIDEFSVGITPRDPRYRKVHDPNEPILAQNRSFTARLNSAMKRAELKTRYQKRASSKPVSKLKLEDCDENTSSFNSIRSME